MNIIEVKSLTKTYTTYKRGSGVRESVKSFFKRERVTVNAVDNVSFDVEKGSICGILGPNGAGKSTVIKMLCGALFPTSGNIVSMGFSPYSDRKKYVSEIGAVFGQRSQLIFDIPPIDSFNMNRAIYGIPQSDYKSRLDELTELFEVEDIMRKPTRVLSLGERMKCEFIMAMLHDPKVVFLDEPTIGVDIIAKEAIRGFIKQKNAEGATIILTTHDLEDIASLAGRVIVINHGEKAFDGSLDSLKKHLGDKKTVRITMRDAAGSAIFGGIDGVEVTGADGRETEFLIDNEIIPMNEFIAFVSNAGIQDISIKELEIGSIIKSIYKAGPLYSGNSLT
ncbi:MAG: ATP-binding cassette domain-containing protein, partial [Oscillospiraceae bacterium]|nr:ATP-binding cassette domain-containing protein [Oscillospiraceae bacterium]